MRRLLTIDEMRARGLTRSAIRWGEKTGRWRAICRGVWGEGPEDPSDVDRALAAVLASGGVACGKLAAFLLGLDSLDMFFDSVAEEFALKPGSSNWRAGARRRLIPAERIIDVADIKCTDTLQTLLDLAAEVNDVQWEQVLESGLRKHGTSLSEIGAAMEGTQGAARIRRVLTLRPPDAPPTESLLETLMVQLARTVPGLPPPVRQYKVFDALGNFVARVDLAWPELGLFLELDGQLHKNQRVYDAHRQTRVVTVTGWLPGRFNWYGVVHIPKTTARQLAALVGQARARAAA